MKIFESGSHVTDEQISHLQSYVKHAIPNAYIDFLRAHNGGYPEPRGFTFKADNVLRKGIVNRFLGLHKERINNLISYIEMYKVSEERLPSNLYPIAHDPGGNLICISYMGNDVGKIYFWDHELEVEEGEQPDYSNVYLIASGLKEFLDNLTDF